MKHFKRLVMAVFAVALSVVSLLPAVPASAADTPSSALSIAPEKEYDIAPGKSVSDKLTIRNLDTASPLDLTLRVIDFTYTDQSGTPKLILDQSLEPTTWSLRDFVTIPKKVTIAPGASKSIDIKVAIPSNQGAGSYYSAIMYSTGDSTSDKVGLSASGTTLVFVTVPGKVHEDLQLKKFGAYSGDVNSKSSKYVFMTTIEPQHMAYTLLNSGNVAEAPVGVITLKDMWGHKITIDDINPIGSRALIGQTRLFTTCIKTKAQSVDFAGEASQGTSCISPGLWPGYYTASLDLFYGQNGNQTNEITKNIVFFYLPWWFIAVVLIVLALVIYFGWKIVRFVREKLGLSKRRRK